MIVAGVSTGVDDCSQSLNRSSQILKIAGPGVKRNF